MNREIKFRGQRSDNKEWVYGSLLLKNGFALIVSNTKNGNYQQFVVIPETVGQFTGVKDKNGVDIYEGDILSLDDGSEVIEMVYNANAFEGKRLYKGIFIQYVQNKNYLQFKVIGSIHSNPEILNNK